MRHRGNPFTGRVLGLREQLRIFPRSWQSGLMTPMDVAEEQGEFEDIGSPTTAMIGPMWSARRVVGAMVNATTGIEREAALSMSTTKGEWRLVMHAAGEPATPPVAVVIFQPRAFRRVSTESIGEIAVVIERFWVAPSRRGEGFADHLVAHLTRYLKQCDLESSGRHPGRGGVAVHVCGNVFTPEERRSLRLVYESFEEERYGRLPGTHKSWVVRRASYDYRSKFVKSDPV